MRCCEVTPLIEPEECVICLEPIVPNSVYTFDCSHQLHYACFHQYFYYNYDMDNNYVSCPVCQKDVKVPFQIRRKNKVKKMLNKLSNCLSFVCSTTEN